MQHLFGHRVLVTVGANDAIRQTCVDMISPNGAYVFLTKLVDGQSRDEHIGWVDAASVKVLDDLGNSWLNEAMDGRWAYEWWVKQATKP